MGGVAPTPKNLRLNSHFNLATSSWIQSFPAPSHLARLAVTPASFSTSRNISRWIRHTSSRSRRSSIPPPCRVAIFYLYRGNCELGARGNSLSREGLRCGAGQARKESWRKVPLQIPLAGWKARPVPKEIAIRRLAFERFLEHRRKGVVARLVTVQAATLAPPAMTFPSASMAFEA